MFCCFCCFAFGGENGGCTSNISPQMFRRAYIISHIILLIFIIATMSIIKWALFSGVNLAFFLIIFFLVLILLILVIIICVLTKDGNYNSKVSTINKIGNILTIICLILCVLEEILLSIGFTQINSKCNGDIESSFHFYGGIVVIKRDGINFPKNSTNSNFSNIGKRILGNNNINGEISDCFDLFISPTVYGMAYFTFTFIEILCIVGFFFWCNSKKDFLQQENEYRNQNARNSQNNENQQNMISPNINIQNPNIVIINQGNNGNNPLPQQVYDNQNNGNINNSKAINQNQNNLMMNYSKEQNPNANSRSFNYPSQSNIIANDRPKYNINNIQRQNNVKKDDNIAKAIDTNIQTSERKDLK